MMPRPGIAAENQQVAELQQLESQAVREAHAGHFDRTDEILGHAKSLSHDPAVEQMATWATTFSHSSKLLPPSTTSNMTNWSGR